jgi:hypothetical protein
VIVDRLRVAPGTYLTRLGVIESGEPGDLDVDWAAVRVERPVEAAHWVALAERVGATALLGEVPDSLAALVAEVHSA